MQLLLFTQSSFEFFQKLEKSLCNKRKACIYYIFRICNTTISGVGEPSLKNRYFYIIWCSFHLWFTFQVKFQEVGNKVDHQLNGVSWRDRDLTNHDLLIPTNGLRMQWNFSKPIWKYLELPILTQQICALGIFIVPFLEMKGVKDSLVHGLCHIWAYIYLIQIIQTRFPYWSMSAQCLK